MKQRDYRYKVSFLYICTLLCIALALEIIKIQDMGGSLQESCCLSWISYYIGILMDTSLWRLSRHIHLGEALGTSHNSSRGSGKLCHQMDYWNISVSLLLMSIAPEEVRNKWIDGYMDGWSGWMSGWMNKCLDGGFPVALTKI